MRPDRRDAQAFPDLGADADHYHDPRQEAEAVPTVPPGAGTPPYQPMPDLTPAEYEALKADIEANGVMVPIEVDENGAILDGHNRQRICAELGLTAPVVVRAGLTEAQKQQHALRLNLQRRHLSSAQKRELIRAELDRDPDRSDREIGRLIGADHKTVASVRRGEIPRVMFTVERVEHHPAADLFPMIPDEELALMAASIKDCGLLDPITLDKDGRLLDGKIRLAACQIAGVEPHFRTYDGGDSWGYVLSVNGNRMHHGTARQKAEIVADVIQWRRDQGKDAPAWQRDSCDYWRNKADEMDAERRREQLARERAARKAAGGAL